MRFRMCHGVKSMSSLSVTYRQMSALCWVSSDDLNLSCCTQRDHRRCVGAILTCVVMIMSILWSLRKSQTICLLVCCHGNVSLAVSYHGACVVAILIWCVVTVMSALHVRMMFSGKRKEARAKVAQHPRNMTTLGREWEGNICVILLCCSVCLYHFASCVCCSISRCWCAKVFGDWL